MEINLVFFMLSKSLSYFNSTNNIKLYINYSLVSVCKYIVKNLCVMLINVSVNDDFILRKY